MSMASALTQWVTRTQRGWMIGPSAVLGTKAGLPVASMVMAADL